MSGKAYISAKLRTAVWQRDGGVCGLCRQPADPLDWAVDHIVPEALDGPTILDNLRVSHPRCNRARPYALGMTELDIEDAAMDWTENEMRRRTLRVVPDCFSISPRPQQASGGR